MGLCLYYWKYYQRNLLKKSLCWNVKMWMKLLCIKTHLLQGWKDKKRSINYMCNKEILFYRGQCWIDVWNPWLQSLQWTSSGTFICVTIISPRRMLHLVKLALIGTEIGCNRSHSDCLRIHYQRRRSNGKY